MVSFSILIITHGREELLLKCLESLRPAGGNWQLILIANGLPLGQKTIAAASALTQQVDVLELNKTERPGFARNRGIELVKHDWVFFIDDDAYVLPKYFETLFPLLEQDRIEVLGGPDTAARGMNNFSQSLATTLSSPFCTGTTFNRHQKKGNKLIAANEEILTSCNLWIRSRLLKETHFPEDYQRTEETALLLDLTQRGVNMFYHPALMVGHHRRKTLKELLRPTYFAGFYRSKVMREKLVSPFYFWLPSIFVLMHLLVLISPDFFWTLARIYTGLIVMMSLNLAARKRHTSLFLYISFLHYFIVFIYGLGFMANRIGMHENKR